jgi:hypothetical protein
MSEEKKSRGFLSTVFGAAYAGVKAGFGAWAGVYMAGKHNGSDPGIFDYLKMGATASFGSWADNIVSGGKHGGFGEGFLTGFEAEEFSGKSHIGLFNSLASMFTGGLSARAIDKVEDTILPASINKFVPAF